MIELGWESGVVSLSYVVLYTVAVSTLNYIKSGMNDVTVINLICPLFLQIHNFRFYNFPFVQFHKITNTDDHVLDCCNSGCLS